MLFADSGRQMVTELLEVLALPLHHLDPIGSIDAQELPHGIVGDLEAGPVDRVDRRHVADVRLLRLAAALAAVERPLENAEVLAEAGPEELPVVRNQFTRKIFGGFFIRFPMSSQWPQ